MAFELIPEKMYQLNFDTLNRYIKYFLADDSSDNYCQKIYISGDLLPDSFTVFERASKPPYLFEDEKEWDLFLNNCIASEIQRAIEANYFTINDLSRVISFLKNQIETLLSFVQNDRFISRQIINQEFPDVITKVISYCAFGFPFKELHLFKKFNEFGELFIPFVINHFLQKHYSTRELLCLSIASGLIGLDLKGTKAAASSFSANGIELRPLLKLDPENISKEIIKQLKEVTEKGFAIDDFDDLESLIQKKENCKICWFPDDFIETMFDLIVINKLLQDHENLSITLVPKKGQNGNDISYEDVLRILKKPIYAGLLIYINSNRFLINPEGPRMGTLNLFKVSKSVVDEIDASDAVIIKGCRIHEMVQGLINKLSFTSYIVVREFSQSETRLDARKLPILFFKLDAGEYGYWGFKGRAFRQDILPDGKEIKLCYSTLIEHRERKSTSDIVALVKDLNYLTSIYESCKSEYGYPYQNETEFITNRLNEITRRTYEDYAEVYRSIKGEVLINNDIMKFNKLLFWANERLRNNLLGNPDGKLTLLDAGTGFGRDLVYFSQFQNLIPYGIDFSSKFVEMLRILASKNLIRPNSFQNGDIRKLDNFQDREFDIVCHNSSFIHLPMLPNRIGADEVIQASYRVLKPNGLLLLVVNYGEGLTCIDYGDGMGPCVFQFYQEHTVFSLLERNKFHIIDFTKQKSYRPNDDEYLIVYAEK